jgi:SpoVK/Ycf46/Vps4 family AAA+-type ATPase
LATHELGKTPEALEERLSDIIDLCTPWHALVLIDEAEMLLERRSKGDVLRNAMVCVMLRLLEYYAGIIFLTTNRVESLDPAFQSRVQCALRYEPLDAAARARVWRDALTHAAPAHAADVDVDALAARALNGRQVKNCVMLALALSGAEHAPLAMRQPRGDGRAHGCL